MAISHRRTYEWCGVDFNRESGDELIANCPFCSGHDKFFMNDKTGLWSCKTCEGKNSGNLWGFYGLVARAARRPLNGKQAVLLSKRRKLPPEVFLRGRDIWGLGWVEGAQRHIIPVLNEKGTVVDLRHCSVPTRQNPTPKWRSMPGSKLRPLGLDRLSAVNGGNARPVVVCEGEWDALAVTWMAEQAGDEVDTVAWPGAGLRWDTEWVAQLRGRPVWLAFDNDAQGRDADARAWDALRGVALSLHSVHWPSHYPEKGDVNTWATYGCVTKAKSVGIEECWKSLQGRLRARPVGSPMPPEGGGNGMATGGNGVSSAPLPPISRQEMVKVVGKWLLIPDELLLAIVFGTVFANRLGQTRVWVFLVGPPGSAKSELLMAVEGWPGAVAVSTLTSHSLVSGFGGTKNDPGLFNQLNGDHPKMLLIKDFTTLLGGNSDALNAVMSQLRDSYDGSYRQSFGNGAVRHYDKLKFGILAGVTPAIDGCSGETQRMGERFLKFRLSDDWTRKTRLAITLRAMRNAANGELDRMQLELKQAVGRFLSRAVKEPKVSAAWSERVAKLAELGTGLMGTVQRHEFRPEEMVGGSFIGMSTRMGMQLTQLAKGIAVYFGHSEVGEEEYRAVARVALDTTPWTRAVVLEAVADMSGGGKWVTRRMVCDRLANITSHSTVARVVNDMRYLKLLQFRRHEHRKITAFEPAEEFRVTRRVKELFPSLFTKLD